MEPSRFRQRLDYADPAAFRSNRYRGMNSMFSGDIYFSAHSHFLRLIKKKKCLYVSDNYGPGSSSYPHDYYGPDVSNPS